MKILVYIENERLQSKAISILANQSYHLFVTKCSQKAWRLLLAEESRPDLIVMYMPQEGDAEFLKKKHGVIDFQDIPVIFLLKNGTKEREEKLNSKVKHDHWSYLCLPVSAESLVKRIELMVSYNSEVKEKEKPPAETVLTFEQLIRQIEDSQRTKRILFVESILERRQLVKRLLELEGFEVIDCTSSHSAWARLVKNRPDLIIWSTCFEGRTGWNDFIALKAGMVEYKNIPILYFVEDREGGLEDLNEWAEERKWRAVSFPFTSDDFFEAINHLLALSIV